MQSPLANAFATHLRSDPSAPVAWTHDGVRCRGDLDALANEVSCGFAALPPGVRIAVSVRDGFHFLAHVLAIWRHGSCALLLDAADPRGPRVDLAQRFGASALCTDDPNARCRLLGAGAPAGELKVIKLTSGSTAEPRGVGAGTAELIADNDALQRSMGIGSGDRLLAAVPMSFSYGVGSLLLPALWRGLPLVIPDHRHPLGLLRAMQRGEPTVWPTVPAVLRATATATGAAAINPALRLVISAGAPLLPSVAAAFRARFGLPVHAFYGATEAGGICYDREGVAAERGTVGAPVDGVHVSLDADGCVLVRSPAVGKALEARDDLRGGVWRSADLGEWQGTDLHLRGRTGEAFDVGGHKVHPREVEQVIAELPGVADAAVVPWRDAAGRAACGALVVGRSVDEAAVRNHCVRHLPAAKVPRCIVFVDALPRTERGKLSRDDAAAMLARAAENGRFL